MVIDHHHHFHICPCSKECGQVIQSLADIKAAIEILNTKADKIIMDEALVSALLTKIDAATTQIAANVQSEADSLTNVSTTVAAIGTDVDALQAALAAALAAGTGVSQALLDQATALQSKTQGASDALQASTDNLAALVPVLTGIASKGAINPVPIPVPPVG